MTPDDFKKPPFPHQLSEFNGHKDDISRGLLWEMGTGKSKETIDQSAHLIDEGKVDCILVVAPDGVHRNWVTDEMPSHMPDRLLKQMKMFCYQTDKAATKWHQADAEAVLAHPGPILIAMTYDSVVTDAITKKCPNSGRRLTIWRGGKAYLWDILKSRKVMYVADEARRIKTPTADRTKVVVKSSPFAKYRRLLNGTPVPNGPFDLFSQMLFLDPNFWRPHGCSTFGAYKQMFGTFITSHVRDANGNVRPFQQLVAYRNLDLLQKILGTICSRVTKDEVLNLPPKLYSRATFQMTAAQEKIYSALRDEYLAVLDDGSLVTAPLTITRMLRFQQVTSGFVPVTQVDADAEPIHDIGTSNPRLELLGQIIEDIPHGCIIWGRFNRTIDKIMEMLGDRAVRYDGQVSSDDRAEAKRKFQAGEAQFFVAKAQSAGEGLTLTKARTVIYVENTFDLAMRQQSEDRAHRIGQEHPVNYIDIIAENTVDDHIVKALLDKFDVANQITGDKVKQWLQSVE